MINKYISTFIYRYSILFNKIVGKKSQNKKLSSNPHAVGLQISRYDLISRSISVQFSANILLEITIRVLREAFTVAPLSP